MSTNLYYRLPVDDKYLGKELKFHIAPEVWGHDGSLGSDWTKVDSSLIPFLKGLVSAGNEDVSKEAKKLLGLIEKYETVEIALVN